MLISHFTVCAIPRERARLIRKQRINHPRLVYVKIESAIFRNASCSPISNSPTAVFRLLSVTKSSNWRISSFYLQRNCMTYAAIHPRSLRTVQNATRTISTFSYSQLTMMTIYYHYYYYYYCL